MKHAASGFKLNLLILAAALIVSGCSHDLVKDDMHSTSSGTDHCSGSEWTDDSSVAVLPIPGVAFFLPHTNLHDINADNYLKRCGNITQLTNREVSVGYGACIPAALTRVLTLGVWQWCPAHVSWEADVLQ